MKSFWLFLCIAAAGNFIYHYGMKSFSSSANPMQVLVLFYALGALLSLTLTPFFGRTDWTQAAAFLGNWRVWLVAFGFILIELGFLLAYRAGGHMQWSGIAVNGMAALLLVPVGILVFREPFSWEKLAGIVITLAGLFLLMRR